MSSSSCDGNYDEIVLAVWEKQFGASFWPKLLAGMWIGLGAAHDDDDDDDDDHDDHDDHEQRIFSSANMTWQ